MTATISAAEWVGFIENDYLRGYIGEGGAAVKFAVPLRDDARAALDQELRSASERLGYLYLTADAATVKMHFIDQVFFRLSAQVRWSQLARLVLFDLAAKEGYRIPAADPGGPAEELLAAEAGLEPSFIRRELRPLIQRSVFKDIELIRDFRVAMTGLCWAEVTGGEEGAASKQAILEWLTGVNTRVSAVRPYGIQARIHRTNARYFFESTLTWARRAGCQGTVVVLDTEAVTIPRRSEEVPLFYTKAAVLDCYEVLRQFVDDTDNLDGCLVVVVPGTDFLEVDMPTRGMGCYQALKFRVYDEVRDRDLVNPMASLVRLSGDGR